MRTTTLGRTGLQVSVIAFGCGANAGVMTGGDRRAQVRMVERALEAGINIFDTAPAYGNGRSETALGAVLAVLGYPDVHIATKVGVDPVPPPGVAVQEYRRNCHDSLDRLQRDRVDLLQVHNRFGPTSAVDPPNGGRVGITLAELEAPGGIGEALVALRDQGKVGWLGFTAYGGDPATLRSVVDLGIFDTVNVSYHALNPTALHETGPGWGALDHGAIGRHAAESDLGVLAIRTLAAGALTPGSDPAQSDDPDVATAPGPLEFVTTKCQELGCSVTELALSFAFGADLISTSVCGFSEVAHIDEAVRLLAEPVLPAAECDAFAAAILAADDGHATRPVDYS